MYERDTVVILGAGASSTFYYPLGADLPAKVKILASQLAAYCKEFPIRLQLPLYLAEKFTQPISDINEAPKIWGALGEEARQLSSKLSRVGNGISIDNFLDQHPSVSDLGRVLVAWIICECEAETYGKNGEESRRQWIDNENWAALFAHYCSFGCEHDADLLENKIRFITFNYDLSLERELYRSLSTRDNFTEQGVKRFIESNRIIHVYGKLNWDYSKHPHFPDDFLQKFDIAYHASQNMRLINPREKILNSELLNTAQKSIATANAVYFLGYGFAGSNNERIGVRYALPTQENRDKKIFFTNHNDSTVLNKIIGNAFGVGEQTFVHATFYSSFQKSTKSTYRALNEDFGLP